MAAIPNIADEDFDREVLAQPLPVVVDFWGPGCHPCMAVGKILEELAKDYTGRVKFVKINTNDYQQKAVQFGLRAIPTLLFFRRGTLMHQVLGYQEKIELQRRIERYLLSPPERTNRGEKGPRHGA